MISERGLDGHDRDAKRWFKRYNKSDPAKGGARKSTATRPQEWLGLGVERVRKLNIERDRDWPDIG